MGKTAVPWPFRYVDMKDSWKRQMLWVCKALQERGYDVHQHPDFVTEIPGAKPYRPGMETDVVIYNHAVHSEIKGPVIKAANTWFFKPTVPSLTHTTLDRLGYGPYSEPTYVEPPYKTMDPEMVARYFGSKVRDWIQARTCKWGAFDEEYVPDGDYYLVLGQIPTDSVVTSMWFGDYCNALLRLVERLVWIGDKRIIVKLHPRMRDKCKAHDNSKAAVEAAKQMNHMRTNLKNALARLGFKVSVYDDYGSVHCFLPKAACVFLCNSGTGFDALMHHKPIITWGLPEYHWVSYDLRHLFDLDNALSLRWYNRSDADKFLYWYTEHYCFYDEATAQRRVDELLGKGE